MRFILIIIFLSFPKFLFSTPMIDYLNQQTPSMLDFGLFQIEQELILNENKNFKNIRSQIGSIAEFNNIRLILDKRYEEEFKGKYDLWDLANTKRELVSFFEKEMRIKPYYKLINVGVNQNKEMYFYSKLQISTPYDFQFDDLLEKSSEKFLKEFPYSTFESIFDDDLETLCKGIRYSIMNMTGLFPFNQYPNDGLSDSGGDFTYTYDFDRSNLNRVMPARFWINYFSSYNYGLPPKDFIEKSDVIFSVLIKYSSSNKNESIICYGKNTETSISFKKGGYDDLDNTIYDTLEVFD